ncbi:hypothetical protein AAY473_007807 [Plecturocebus cupreus]
MKKPGGQWEWEPTRMPPAQDTEQLALPETSSSGRLECSGATMVHCSLNLSGSTYGRRPCYLNPDVFSSISLPELKLFFTPRALLSSQPSYVLFHTLHTQDEDVAMESCFVAQAAVQWHHHGRLIAALTSWAQAILLLYSLPSSWEERYAPPPFAILNILCRVEVLGGKSFPLWECFYAQRKTIGRK